MGDLTTVTQSAEKLCTLKKTIASVVVGQEERPPGTYKRPWRLRTNNRPHCFIRDVKVKKATLE